MIKAITPDKKLLILGLSDENVARIQKDDPILIDAAQLGLGEFKILLFHGKDEMSMRETLKSHGVSFQHETLDMRVIREQKGKSDANPSPKPV